MTPIKSFLSPKGRIGPQTFWIGFAILSGVSIGVLFIPRAGGILWLASFIPWIFLNAKRLHDMNRSGWVQAIPYAVYSVALIAAVALFGSAVFLALFSQSPTQATLDMSSAAGASAFLLMTAGLGIFNIAWLVWIGTTHGDRDKNRFGPPEGQGRSTV